MAKKRKNKKQKAVDFHGLFIQKRTDKAGRNYFIDREGKRRKGVEYHVQWSKTGRVNKNTFEKTLAQLERFDISDQDEARLIADDFETLRRARALRKKEIELLESETTGHSMFYQATDIIRQADDQGATIKVLAPDGDKFLTLKGPDAMETAHRFIKSVSESIEEVKGADKSVKSPLIQFGFQHDIENNTFYIDFRNLSGMDDFILLQQLIRDNFEA